MDGMVVAFFVPTVVFIVFVLPVWLFMHYRTKQHAQSSLSEAEREEIAELANSSQRMIDRIEILEAILDEEAPDWRERNTERFTSA